MMSSGPISSLSGGERGRVALAKLALGGASLLLLDEPTNHLDIDSQEVLQEVLGSFSGTILLVSHDRYLVDALATQIWEISPGDMQVIDGDYQEYLRWRNRATQGEVARKEYPGRRVKKPAAYSEKKHGLNPFEAEKHSAALEEKIQELETSLERNQPATGRRQPRRRYEKSAKARSRLFPS